MSAHNYLQFRTVRFFITLLTGLLGGALFQWVGLPVPWLLGPMISVLIGSTFIKGVYMWPGGVRNTGLIIVGYTIGLAMTATALRAMGHQLPIMLLLTALLLLMCAAIAYLVARLSGLDYMTVLMGSIPGGLSQMIILAEESKGINITVVTFFQVVRVIMIVVFIPLLIFSPALGLSVDEGASAGAGSAAAAESVAHWSGLYPQGLLFAVVCVLGAWAGNRIKLPTPYLLGPAIGAAALQLCGIEGPGLPGSLIDAAQLMIGTYVGLLLRPERLINKRRTIPLAVGSGVLLLLGAWGLSWLMMQLQPISLATSVLSMAPGGMDQMGIIAHVIHADLSTVAGYQLFRLLFIFFAVPPVMRALLRLRKGFK